MTRKKTDAVAGLDIEAGSIAAAEVHVNGSAQVTASAIEPLPAGVFGEGEVADADGLAEALKSLFSKHKLSKRVRLGVGNQRVVVRTLRLPAIEDPKELDAAVRFQAQEEMPMPLDQAVLEHQVVGGVPAEEGSQPQIDVVVVAARRDMVASFLDPIRRAGLQPVGIDLSAFGMIRALAGVDVDEPAGNGAQGQPTGAVLYCSLGDVTNLAVARGRACLFTRVSHVGLETIAGRFAGAHGLSLEHADQWLAHVGLERAPEEIEGDPEIVAEARGALEEGVSGLIDELRLSLDYYGAQEGALRVERVVLCGPGSAIPGLGGRLEAALGLAVAPVRPPGLSAFDERAAARLTLPYGLALEH
ncbi:MAG TPA: type IV pilus assembly protein PilM [Solirubrobacterales bacterium]|nr:type IV pilus assembly protein PilM [Solirubrobacterales bacterium]